MRLCAKLGSLAQENPVIVALPRGGVPVAYEVAQRLGAPLEVLAVRKLGAPANPELGVGAIAEDETAIVNADTAQRVGMTESELQRTVEREAREMQRQVELYRGGHAPLDVRGRTVIVIDDGLATGLTDLAAVRTLRGRGAARIVVAVPVGPRDSLALVGAEADEIVCHTVPEELLGVSRWYEDFSPVPDAEVLALLRAASTAQAARTQMSPPPHGAPARRVPEPRELALELEGAALGAELTLPERSEGLVIFAHGSGSSRHSPRNRAVAAILQRAGLATLLFDLLTEAEGRRRELVFDIPLLARRLEGATRWAIDQAAMRNLAVGYFGASTGAAAALRAAAGARNVVSAIVSRGGRVDLAGELLPGVQAPTLLLVGSRDGEVLELNRRAAELLRCVHRLEVVDGADHLFTQPGALDTVATLAAQWFKEHLARAQAQHVATHA